LAMVARGQPRDARPTRRRDHQRRQGRRRHGWRHPRSRPPDRPRRSPAALAIRSHRGCPGRSALRRRSRSCPGGIRCTTADGRSDPRPTRRLRRRPPDPRGRRRGSGRCPILHPPGPDPARRSRRRSDPAPARTDHRHRCAGVPRPRRTLGRAQRRSPRATGPDHQDRAPARPPSAHPGPGSPPPSSSVRSCCFGACGSLVRRGTGPRSGRRYGASHAIPAGSPPSPSRPGELR
jgi:hypothetical protein